MRMLLLALCLAGPVAAQQIRVVDLPPNVLNREAYVFLPRNSAMGLVLPTGDTLWVGNVVDTLDVPGERFPPECDSLVAAVSTSRLKVAVNQKILAEMPIRERGRGALTPSFQLALPNGARLIVREVYRRKSACGVVDGTLVVWFVLVS